MKPKTHRKPAERKTRVAKVSTAREAIGIIEPNTDTFILTYGQFSLIDALVVILDQTGPADVVVSTWTAADAHLERTAALIESAEMRSFRMIIDASFEARKPDYCHHMRELFGPDCIRAITTHSKFMLVQSDTHNIVVRTSMNLNENPRLENMEISEDRGFATFFRQITDNIFAELKDGMGNQRLPQLNELQESFPFMSIDAPQIKRETLNEVETTHTLRRSNG